ncbi:metabotropic glutamate receptor 3-like, partial [Engystomops pustulosus]|uniref:metabotropic glutamate receptor 3-like n=1 Tax=Engystomops pustulosus TaxID=76066 RepID=UPI003AFB7DAB
MAALSWTLLSLAVLCSNGEHVSREESPKQELEIFGIFPTHIRHITHDWARRGGDFYESVQAVEAMRFAIEEINRNSTFLPGIKLVPVIRFLCTCTLIDAQVRDLRNSRPVAVVVDIKEDVGSAEALTYIEGLKIPALSYSRRGLNLPKHPVFLRVVPPAQYQNKALVDLLIHHGWTYVSIVVSSGSTFASFVEDFKKEAEVHNICFPTTIVLCYHVDYINYVRNLQSHPMAEVVVVFVLQYDLEHLLAAAHTLNATFTWVVGNPWGLPEKDLDTYNKISGNVIMLDIQSSHLQRFNEHFQAMKKEANVYNYTDPTIKSLFSDDFIFHSIPGEENITVDEFQPSPKIQSVVNAVYAIAHALQNMSSSTCPNMSADCVRENNDIFMTFLRKTRFTAPLTDPEVQYTVKFDHNSNGPARYNIFTIQEINGSFQYQQIGSWAEELTLNSNQTMWENNTAPESRCGKTCGNQEKKMTVPGYPCCWVCVMCQPNELLLNETTCKECDPGYQPNTDHSGCISYIQWGDGLAIGPLCFSGLGILSTIFVGGVLLWNNNTPIVKASGREFCYILLSGVLLLYIMTFTFIARPSVVICGLRRLGLATSFAICYSALLTKTNRITRIFNSAQKGIAPPRYINLASQLSICLALITCQILGLVIWLIVDPAEVIESISPDKHITLQCKLGDIKILFSLVYNVLLILLCTVYAFKTRKYPENFNEAKCIGFTMYTTCIIWLAFMPVFYVTSDHPKVQVTALCTSISLCGLVIIGGVFVPKLYIIFCHPEKNVKSVQRVNPSSHTESSR